MTENIGHRNQRWHPRVAWNAAIRLRPHESDLDWELSKMRNISLGGCFFNSEVPYEPGEVLEIEIRSAMLKGKVNFLGSVKRRVLNDGEADKKYGVAVHFIEMVEDETNSFLETMQSLMKQSSGN